MAYVQTLSILRVNYQISLCHFKTVGFHESNNVFDYLPTLLVTFAEFLCFLNISYNFTQLAVDI